ncbi:hypothetical protein [Erythrobacter sp. JK5]|uniref:hypothetical protein n=1 Tax=Erythrobacter sp. JK5 TaxID=2829500 RepID=UPI001BA645B5|nr:hypothetical protein [Erythrobacter sp. JK5]QUL36639.1 hypothetical protein KDC96_09330 [Erythrobacter sp. JK5]
MSDFSEEFDFSARKSGKGLFAEGEWHGDDVTLIAALDGDAAEAIDTLERLHKSWKAWSSDLRDAIEEEYGEAGDIWIERITAFAKGEFEIEFGAPDLFDEDTGLATGNLKDGFDEIGTVG